MKLSNSQQAVHDKLLDFLINSTEKVALLEGKPGTGKSTVISELIKSYKRRSILTAPTNKATKILEAMTTSADYTPDTCTIYSLLGLKLVAKGAIREVAASDKDVDISRYSLIIIDECSMINQTLLKYINKAINKYPIKVIFLGDSLQLPPVGEDFSSTFHLKLEYKLKLTEVMRHKGAILSVVDEIRKSIDNPMKIDLPFLENLEYRNPESSVYVCDQKEFLSKILDQAFISTDNMKVIAWKNVTVDFFNSKIRELLFTSKANFYEVGDTITVTAPTKDIEDKITATIDEIGIIEHVSYAQHLSIPGLEIARITCTMSDNKTKIFSPVSEKSKKYWQEILDDNFNKAKHNVITWDSYWKLYDNVHYIKHAYAITAHRSQGSTYDIVFVNMNDILRNTNRSEALRCLNVACSRAKVKLIIGK